MRCPRCQVENLPGTRFCGQCSALLASACPSCGGSNPPANKFCGQCAAPLDTTAQTRFTTPNSYTPKHLADKILTSKAALEGERKQVTVLFADLKGSMELLADRDPDEARDILDPVLGLMMEAVHRYEGTVNQVMGDGIMALFGAPVAHEDHAVRACYAALRMQETVKRYATDVSRREGPPVQIRVGLNSGEVVVRSIGSDLHMDYTAVGQTTHLAARMEQSAKPGTILIPTETLRLVENFVHVQSLGAMTLKGLAEPLEVFELIGANAIPSRLHAAGTQGLTEFVGRDDEFLALQAALEHAEAGRGRVVTVIGEPGIGKSRLLWEFIRSHRTQGCLVLETHAVSYGKATPYLPVTDVLRRYFEIEHDDDVGQIRAKVNDKIVVLDESLRGVVPAVLSLLDVPTDDPEWESLDGPPRRRRTLDALKRLLFRESERQPLVFVVEDLHWIDSESEALLDGLIHGLPSARVLLLVTYRPEYRHGWDTRRACIRLPLDSLPPPSAHALLQSLLGSDDALEPVKALLIERTAGNPFFLEESVRTLIETRVLIGERGAYQLAKPLAAIQVPATVQSVLAARIDRLSPDEKRLLQSASVIGKEVPLPLLEIIGEMAEPALYDALANLQAAEFLYERRLFPEVVYTFRHALTHEVAYGSLVRDRRRALHRQLVYAMERLYTDHLADHAEQLAHHALRGELWPVAVPYLQMAARKATARSASHEARIHLEQALEALRRLAESQDVRELSVDLRIEIQEALQPLGELPQMLNYLREAQTLAEALGDELRLGRVLAHIAYCLWWTGDPDGAIQSGRQAIATVSTRRELSLEVLATFRLGMAYFFSGALREAIALFRHNIELLSGERSQERFGLPHLPAVFSRVYHAWALACIGSFDSAREHADEAVRLAEACRHPFTTVWAHVGVGLTHYAQGRLPAAVRALECSMTLWRNTDSWAFMFPWVAEPLGHVYAVTGRRDEAVELLEQSAERSATMKVIPLLTRDLTSLGEAYLLAGRFSDARQSTERALQLCRLHGQRLIEPEALRVAGEVSARQTSPDVVGALEYQRQALTLAIDLGMRPLAARCHFGLGKIHQRVGDLEQARQHLDTATTMFREMKMTYWLEHDEGEPG